MADGATTVHGPSAGRVATGRAVYQDASVVALARGSNALAVYQVAADAAKDCMGKAGAAPVPQAMATV